jgi:hypothetical protein
MKSFTNYLFNRWNLLASLPIMAGLRVVGTVGGFVESSCVPARKFIHSVYEMSYVSQKGEA